jgi:dephospho-CoA kinase
MNNVIIGLTGRSGTGKTSVCKVFKSNGFGIINADLIARQVVKRDSIGLKLLTDEFGKQILNNDKTLNRKLLGSIVFNNKEKLSKLNEIIFPLIIKSIQNQVNVLAKDYLYILLDAPTLFESDADKLCDYIIGIISDKEVLLKRIITRDNISQQSAKNRIDCQLDNDFFVKNCDFIITNNQSVQAFEKSAIDIIEIIKKNYEVNYD